MDPSQKHAGMTGYSLCKYHSGKKPGFHTTQAHHITFAIIRVHLRLALEIKNPRMAGLTDKK
jgi:hypothetical protein